jgi:hypothetical protein
MIYYPQASIILKVRLEDFGEEKNEKLQRVYDLPILARRVTVTINDYREADTFDAEIDYKSFPFDPRSIRACGVTIFMQDTKKLSDVIQPVEENAVFVGFADEESISFDDENRTVRLEGRDFTSILIDRKYPKGTIDLQKRVDQVIQEILDELPENKNASEKNKIKLDNRVQETLPVLAKFWGDKGELSGKKNVKKDETYWDTIQDIVARAGLIAYIELDKLVLSKPRVLYDSQKRVSFVYGQNLKNLEFKRKIGRRKNFNIIVRSLNVNSALDPVLDARIPLEATSDWSKETGIPNKEVKLPEIRPDGTPVPEADAKAAQYIGFVVPNVKSKDQLIKIGQELYEEIGRQQIEGSFETYEMSAIESDETDTMKSVVSLLKLRCGSPLIIRVDQGDMRGFNDLYKKNSKGEELYTNQERIKFLVTRGFNNQIASALVEAKNRLDKYKQPFYTKSVQFTMDGSSGFKCKVEFLNFIEVPRALAGKL